MAPGAVVAILAAAHTRRLQEVMDAFRLAGATAPERARTIAALGVPHAAEVEELAKAGVLLPGPREETWYLSEAAVIARRDGQGTSRRALLVSMALLVLALALLIVVFRAKRGSRERDRPVTHDTRGNVVRVRTYQSIPDHAVFSRQMT